MLNATVSRWRGGEPLGFQAGDTNLYRYVGNDPTDAIDPSGLAKYTLKSVSPVGSIGEVTKRAGNFGAFAYPINWDITPAAEKGGYVIQLVTIRWRINTSDKYDEFYHQLLAAHFKQESTGKMSASWRKYEDKSERDEKRKKRVKITEASYLEAFRIDPGKDSSSDAAAPGAFLDAFAADLGGDAVRDLRNVSADDWFFILGTREYPRANPFFGGRLLPGNRVVTSGWMEFVGEARYYDGLSEAQLRAEGFSRPRPGRRALWTGAGNLFSRPVGSGTQYDPYIKYYKTDFPKKHPNNSPLIVHYIRAEWGLTGPVKLSTTPPADLKGRLKLKTD